MPKYSPEVQFLKDCWGGAWAGVACIGVGQPFDFVKTRMQAMGYTSSAQVIKHAIKTEGIFALYKGSLVPLMLNSPACSVLISGYGGSKRTMQKFGLLNSKPLLQSFIAGGIGGSAMALVATPMEHIRIRMQTQTAEVGAYTGSIDATVKIFRNHGLSGIYKGATVTLVRDAYGFACYFATYDTIKKLYLSDPDKPPSTIQTLSAGSLAGVALWSARYPLDTVKTRIQADSISDPKYRGMIDCFTKTIKSEGVGALYKGFSACILRTIPVNAGFFWAYETSSWLFDKAMGKE
mmetsp:Transcript_13023/g.31913  ORF Transcript_13023/g.31913 Transcript_13023/m.31913 type:complete len:292 (+) Transcript_13023:113-988(+)